MFKFTKNSSPAENSKSESDSSSDSADIKDSEQAVETGKNLNADIKNPLLVKFVSDIDRLKSQAEANSELRKLYDDKFARISENLGSLHQQMTTREKEIQKLEVAAIRASDLVKEVQPETLMAQVKKVDLKIDTVKSKMDAYEVVNERLFTEIKELREVVKVFKGTEEIAKLNKELLQGQAALQKIQSNIERHADKVEGIYAEINKTFEDYMEFKNFYKLLHEDFKSMKKDYENTKLRLSKTVSLEQFKELDNFVVGFEKRANAQLRLVKEFEEYPNFITMVKKVQEDIGTLTYNNAQLREKIEKLPPMSEFVNLQNMINDISKDVEVKTMFLDGLKQFDIINKFDLLAKLQESQRINLETAAVGMKKFQDTFDLKLVEISNMTKQIEEKQTGESENQKRIFDEKIIYMDEIKNQIIGQNKNIEANNENLKKKLDRLESELSQIKIQNENESSKLNLDFPKKFTEVESELKAILEKIQITQNSQDMMKVDVYSKIKEVSESAQMNNYQISETRNEIFSKERISEQEKLLKTVSEILESQKELSDDLSKVRKDMDYRFLHASLNSEQASSNSTSENLTGDTTSNGLTSTQNVRIIDESLINRMNEMEERLEKFAHVIEKLVKVIKNV